MANQESAPKPAEQSAGMSPFLRNAIIAVILVGAFGAAYYLGWYRRNARDLPWRRRCDPYSVLVSETMLQQNPRV